MTLLDKVDNVDKVSNVDKLVKEENEDMLYNVDNICICALQLIL